MGAIPEMLPPTARIGCMVGLATNRKLVPRELVVAMSMQPPPTHFSTGMLMVVDQPIEKARELLAEAAMVAQSKYLWFVDDDTIPPPNALRRLHYVLENNPDVAVAGGVYMTKCDPPGPVIFRGMGLGPFWNWKVGDVFEVTGMGAGCMLIKCEIFNKIPKPWFPWIEDQSTTPQIPSVTISEDINFCNAVRAAGYKVVAHGGILCDHYDHATGKTYSLPESSYPFQPREQQTPAQLETPNEDNNNGSISSCCT